MTVTLPRARSLLVAPRLPSFPKEYMGNPFSSIGDIVVDCDKDGCGWHAIGTRSDMQKAVKAHNQMYHSTEIGVILLNQPRH